MLTFQNEKEGKLRPKGPKQRLGSWGGGSEPPPHQLGGLGDRCKLRQQVQGGATATTRFLLYLNFFFKCSGGLSCYITGSDGMVDLDVKSGKSCHKRDGWHICIRIQRAFWCHRNVIRTLDVSVTEDTDQKTYVKSRLFS